MPVPEFYYQELKEVLHSPVLSPEERLRILEGEKLVAQALEGVEAMLEHALVNHPCGAPRLRGKNV